MPARVLLRDPEGQVHELVPGDLVGRVWSAALHLNDARVSEAHAMVSLREGLLHLIALRGAFAVEGQPLPQVPLAPGQRIQLAQGLEIEVVEVHLPDHVLGVEGPGVPRQALPGVCSVLSTPSVRLARGWRAEAEWTVWTTGDAWIARHRDGTTRELGGGDELAVGGSALRGVEMPLSSAGGSVTRRLGEVDAPLRIVANYDTVHIHRGNTVAASLAGKQARLVSELVAFEGPVAWTTLSAELWPDEPDAALRRSRLDVVLTRIRRSLRSRGVRTDLVRADGAGMVELLLYPHDSVEDRT